MIFLVEMDRMKSGVMWTPEAGQAFIGQIILPTLGRAEQLVAEKRILAGGPVVGRVALRFLLEADSTQEVDKLIGSLPLWPLAETRITPLIGFTDRRKSVQMLLFRI